MSAWLGEVYPFSRVSMYAEAIGRTAGALPVFSADGRAASVQDYHRFTGDPPADIDPGAGCRASGECAAFPCSLGYIPRRDIAWISAHLGANEGAGEGPVEVRYHYRLITLEGERLIVGAETLVWRGRAWRR